jgi:hypothetical protein
MPVLSFLLLRVVLGHAGVNDLERSDPGEGQASKYALLISDTYLIDDGEPTQLTSTCPRNWSDAAYFFKVRKQESLCANVNLLLLLLGSLSDT